MAMGTPDRVFMERALALARAAAAAGEVPVGAVVVLRDIIVGEGQNRMRAGADPAAHAEMEALRAAGAERGGRLDGAVLYVTLEPCPMCAFAALLGRVERIVFGAPDPKAGGCGSILNIPAGPFNHHIAVTGGVLAAESSLLLKAFFEERRGAAA